VQIRSHQLGLPSSRFKDLRALDGIAGALRQAPAAGEPDVHVSSLAPWLGGCGGRAFYRQLQIDKHGPYISVTSGTPECEESILSGLHEG